ncbi:putative D-lactaldehyde dehydrogenase [Mrakia frigida]|uniref:SDR family oxidoreductase n=1 Tax=Mrakia frigida TaxID=29902 RepID=UPI003FCC242B
MTLSRSRSAFVAASLLPSLLPPLSSLPPRLLPSSIAVHVPPPSGFIAVHVAKALLADGFKVIGTVRSEEKGKYLVNLLKNDSFSFVIVKDISEPNAFDEAVKGVEGIVHTASPFYMTAGSVSELVGPAVQGTVGVLKSAKKNGKDVKRVVVTSSVASIQNTNVTTPGKVWTESDWNTFSVSEIEEKGDKAAGYHLYMASKTLAERAAWEFIEKEKPSFSLATINPPYVFGPILHQVESASSLNTSVGVFFPTAKGEKKASDLPGTVGNWVDVRDVAFAHAKALALPEAGGNRFITGAGPCCVQDFTESLLKAYPSLPNIPTGQPGAAAEANKKSQVFDGSKATQVLGLKYHTMDETVKDMYDSIKAKSFL